MRSLYFSYYHNTSLAASLLNGLGPAAAGAAASGAGAGAAASGAAAASADLAA